MTVESQVPLSYRSALEFTDPEELLMPALKTRDIETQRKKRRRAIPRAKLSRPQGNTAGVRKRLKKLAGIARAQV